MARLLPTIYTIHRRSWLGSDNAPRAYWEVLSGHSSRDYQAQNYSPTQKSEGKFRSEAEALAFVSSLEG